MKEGNNQLIGKRDEKDQVADLVMSLIRREMPSFEAQDPLIEVTFEQLMSQGKLKLVAYLARVNEIN